jgi:Protein of unknown function (DUF3631)
MNALEESPWGAWNQGTGITARETAKHLRPHDIEPRQIRIGEKTAKGGVTGRERPAIGCNTYPGGAKNATGGVGASGP